MRVSHLIRFLAAASLLTAATVILATRPLNPNATPRRHYLDLHDENVQASLAIADFMARLVFPAKPPTEPFDFARARMRNSMGFDWESSARELLRGEHLDGMFETQVRTALGVPAFQGDRRWIYLVGDHDFLLDDFGMRISFDTYGKVTQVEIIEMALPDGDDARRQYFASLAAAPR